MEASRYARRSTRTVRIGLAVLAALVIAACAPALGTPGTTTGISLTSTTTTGGWKYDFYTDTTYPCSISGFQTFTIATKVGSSPTAARPLWVFLHGGGVGFFDSTGTPQPDTSFMTQETATSLRAKLTTAGTMQNVRDDAAGFRLLAVSYCNRDVYSGGLQVDPNNPNKLPDGSSRTTNGLFATKAAIQFARSTYPTTKHFLQGGSAGSAGSYNVAWSLQQQGIPPAGVIADASIINVEAGAAAYDQGVCTTLKFSPAADEIIADRFHPDLGDIANEADKLVSSGRLTVPLLHIWNHGDLNTCGSKPMICPTRDGTSVTLGVTDCVHDPMRIAIAGLGAGSRSKNLGLCVSTATRPGTCDKHVVSNSAGLTNTDPSTPADYIATILTWIHQRLADT